MPRVAKSAPPKAAPVPTARTRRIQTRKPAVRPAPPVPHSWPKGGGARILTREEMMASLPPLPPGAESGRDWMRKAFRPLREYNLWLIQNGHEGLGELDVSLREGSDV